MKNNQKVVAIVFHDTEFNSGGTRSLLDLVDKMLENERLRLICIFPRQTGSAIDYLKDKQLEIIACRYWYCTRPITADFSTRIKLGLKLLLSKINVEKLIHNKLKHYNIDLVYSNTGVIYTGAWISSALVVPHIWHIREFLDSDHGLVPIEGWKKYYSFVNQHCTVAILISNALKKKHEVGIDSNKIRVIHDDLSPNYLIKPDSAWDSRKYNLLFAGTICEGKGQLIAIQALSLLKERGLALELFIAGTVKDRDQGYYQLLKKTVQEGYLENQVHFLGQINNLSEIRKKCGIGIVASRTEAFGRVTIEGMLADLVMIGADAGGTAELITDGENGYLYPLDDYLKLADIIEEVVSEDTSEIRKKALNTGMEYISGQCADKLTEIVFEL